MKNQKGNPYSCFFLLKNTCYLHGMVYIMHSNTPSVCTVNQTFCLQLLKYLKKKSFTSGVKLQISCVFNKNFQSWDCRYKTNKIFC